MRCVEKPQMKLGQINIATIKIDPRSRDDIPKILQGLQHLYMKEDVRTEIFRILEENISPKVDKENGRPGMDLWQILVLGVLRLNLNEDYDRVQEHANNHHVIRKMLGHSDVFDRYHYPLQTIKDNVRLLTPELLDKINQVVVKAGHALLKKKTQKA